MNFTEEVGIYFDTTSMLGRFLCLAKFDFSDRHENRFDSIVNFKREKIYFCHVESRFERFEYFSLLPRGIRGLISEINSVTGVQISIVLINKQMYRRANICHEGGVDHGSRIRRLQAQV